MRAGDRRRLLRRSAHLKSIEDLESLTDRIIPYAMTTTSIIQSILVKRCPPPIVSNLDEGAQRVATGGGNRSWRGCGPVAERAICRQIVIKRTYG